MAASISAVAAICASAPTITQGQKISGGRGGSCPSAIITAARKTKAKGNPNRKRTWVAPTVPSLAVSSRCVALRTVCALAAMTVNSAQSQPVSGTKIPFQERAASFLQEGGSMQQPIGHGGLPLHAQKRDDPVFTGDQRSMSESKRIG